MRHIGWVIITLMVVGCGAVTSTVTETPTSSPVSSCDQSLWDHVYHAYRLQVINPCMTVSGTIDVVRQEADGDNHILVKLDPQYIGLLNSVNASDQHGDLVVETICVNPVTQADAVQACNGYQSNVTIPSTGTHVTITGSYVLDKDHGWMEIHPVTSITEGQ